MNQLSQCDTLQSRGGIYDFVQIRNTVRAFDRARELTILVEPRSYLSVVIFDILPRFWIIGEIQRRARAVLIRRGFGGARHYFRRRTDSARRWRGRSRIPHGGTWMLCARWFVFRTRANTDDNIREPAVSVDDNDDDVCEAQRTRVLPFHGRCRSREWQYRSIIRSTGRRCSPLSAVRIALCAPTIASGQSVEMVDCNRLVNKSRFTDGHDATCG